MSTDLDLSHLTSDEKEAILSVLNRDTELRKLEQERIRQLKEELHALRMKGVNKGDRSATQSCSRCCEAFGWFFNRGVICMQCLQKVCDKCQHVFPAGRVLCVFCLKQLELEAKCATWFYAKVPRKMVVDKTTNEVITGSDVTKASLLRVRPSHLTRRRRRFAASWLTKPRSGTSEDEAGSAVGTTLDEVRRVLAKSSGPDVEVSFVSCDDAGDRKFGTPNDSTAYPQEEDKKLLKDLLDLRNFGLSTPKSVPSSAVKVQQVYTSKYRDSDSSDDDSVGEVDSPHLSSCSGSVFRKSDSIRSSLQTNCSSVVYNSSEGAANKALAGGSVHDNSLHLLNPYSQPEEPSNQNLNRYSDERCSVTSRLSGVSQTADEEQLTDGQSSDSAADSVTAVAAAAGASASAVRGTSHFEPAADETDSLKMMMPYKTTGDFSRSNYEENNNTSPPSSTSSSQPGRNSAINNRQSVSSLGSPISASMPSIAALAAVNLSNNKNNAGVNGTASDEENEDIGEMFALYGGSRKANSQTNLNKLSLYSGSKESITSCYSNAGEENYGKYPVTGEILFGLNYNYTLNILEITIRRCKDLAPVDEKRNRSDPYVKTYLLPDRTKTGKRKTRVKKHTLNPVFDEIMKYQIMKSELETRTLSLMVWNNDRFGRNDFLGEVNIPLDYYPFDNPTPIWHKLQDRVPSPVSMLTYKGDLNLCLKFVGAEHISGKRRGPSYKGELQVIVKEARNLTAVRSNGFSDPFCKGYLLPEKSQKSKQKTTVIKKNCSPKWNHTFLFENVSWDELQQRSLELTLWDYDRLTSNDFLGGVRLNLGTGQANGRDVEYMDSKGDELALWQAMLDRPNCWIEGTLLLRLNMNQRK